jgi:hypothetical protein
MLRGEYATELSTELEIGWARGGREDLQVCKLRGHVDYGLTYFNSFENALLIQ